MARPVSHRLGCEHLEERAVPADVGCAAEGAVAGEGEAVAATGDTFTGEVADAAAGVLGAYPVRVGEDGAVVAVATPEGAAPIEPAPAEVPVQLPAELNPAANPFNVQDVMVVDPQVDLMKALLAEPELVHEETHPAGRRISEGTLTWGVDVLLTVDPVDVVKLVAGLLGEAGQAA